MAEPLGSSRWAAHFGTETVSVLCLKLGAAESTAYPRKKRSGGLHLAEVRRLKQLDGRAAAGNTAELCSGPARPAGAGSAQTLTLADSNALAAASPPGVVAVAPHVGATGQLIGTAANVRVSVIGTTAEYAVVRSSAFECGTFFTDRDVARGALRIVLGADAAETVFPDGGAVGRTVRLAFPAMSGLASLSSAYWNATVVELGGSDNSVFVPISTLQARVGGLSRKSAGQIFVNQISVQTDPGVSQAEVKSRLEDSLASRHRVSTPDFSVQTQDDLLSTVR